MLNDIYKGIIRVCVVTGMLIDDSLTRSHFHLECTRWGPGREAAAAMIY